MRTFVFLRFNTLTQFLTLKISKNAIRLFFCHPLAVLHNRIIIDSSAIKPLKCDKMQKRTQIYAGVLSVKRLSVNKRRNQTAYQLSLPALSSLLCLNKQKQTKLFQNSSFVEYPGKHSLRGVKKC